MLVDGASYHWIFWLGAAMAAAAAVLTQLLIPESPNRHARPRSTSAAPSCSRSASPLPLLAIARANDVGLGRAPRTLVLIAAGVVILAGWVALQKRTRAAARRRRAARAARPC